MAAGHRNSLEEEVGAPTREGVDLPGTAGMATDVVDSGAYTDAGTAVEEAAEAHTGTAAADTAAAEAHDWRIGGGGPEATGGIPDAPDAATAPAGESSLPNRDGLDGMEPTGARGSS